ncbi:MAG: hypothetical protein F4Z14_09745 [Gammaproteobacteria bacterium]|nr:hypothetical protein [Gammaproteobacteria bacterium]
MLDFSTDTIANWIALGSLVIASVAVFWTIRIDIRTKRATNEKLLRLEDAVAAGFNRLDRKVNEIDKNFQRLKGYLEGAGIVERSKQDNTDD